MLHLIAYTPSGLADPAIAIAASRAGGLGVLNLEYTSDPKAIGKALEKLARHAARPCGLKLGSSAFRFVNDLLAVPPSFVDTIVLTPWTEEKLEPLVPALKQAGYRVLLETTSVSHGVLGAQLQVDGLIAKGNEAGGWVGEETTFILLQHLLGKVRLPIWAYGGIGIHTAAACLAAGAAGVVLETQLALTREATLPEPVQTAIAAMDGSETLCVGSELGRSFRAYMRPGATALESLRDLAFALAAEDGDPAGRSARWQAAVEARAGWGSLQEQVWPLDQAATFAAPLAQRFVTVAGVLDGIRREATGHITVARTTKPLAPGSPLALAHRTAYPIVQGPMTRVSDTAEFALRVAEQGGLPFLALALMRAEEVAALLESTKQLLGDRPWGVGILGFVPLALRQEQMEVIGRYAPPFALIAGGRPDQALALESQGIPTYLHVPSPGLLRLFARDGARRFVFEGRECGGHVGPRSSFVLWNSMVDTLLEVLAPDELAECSVLFAGGVHDARSAAMVASLSAPLAQRGVRIGVLMGTAYLFTEEAVAAGAILPGFQARALECHETILLESGPGHATRCVPTPYVSAFQQAKRRLQQELHSSEEVRHALEELNVGRLRIASKGITRNAGYTAEPAAPKFVQVATDDQYREGMYMIGQVAALREATCTIADLHAEVSVGGAQFLEQLALAEPVPSPAQAPKPSQVAIVGISAIVPGAADRQEFWHNILAKVNALREVPTERWDAELYFDPDRTTLDKIYAKRGGFMDDVPFDPLEFGIPPSSLSSIEPMHLLALLATRDALADAGYRERPFDRNRTSVILGASGGISELGSRYLLRAGLPLLFGGKGFELATEAGSVLPEWTEDSFAGVLLNVTAGRVANRFDLGGLNYVVDAACASSLAALHAAVKELETYDADMVITGGVDATQTPFGYLCFSKTQALSPTGEARVFDAAGDGIVISEGIVILVLKRLADAERDGDRIYAVIQAVAGSSDGRAMGMTAPRPEGQALALERAYQKAGFSPVTVDLFEAHGTGTVVGDRTEATTLSHFLASYGAQPNSHAIGSIKSMIGHTKATAGAASVAKVALALYHRALPPTLGVTRPNPKAGFGSGPLYVNSEVRPWLHGVQDYPRRAGVSAFGFGGTNFHAVLEEYTGDYLLERREAVMQRWPAELFVWAAASRQELAAALSSLRQALEAGAAPALRDLAYSLWAAVEEWDAAKRLRLAVVAGSLDDLQQKLAVVESALQSAAPVELDHAGGIYLTETPLAPAGQVAFLFPGQGSQYPNMLRDLAVHFREVAEVFEQVDRTLAESSAQLISGFVFPPPAFTPEEERSQLEALTRTDIAQPSLGAAGAAMLRLLAQMGVTPQLAGGHSYGEYVALYAAQVIDLDELARLSFARGRAIIEAADGDLGAMAAVRADAATVSSVLASIPDVWIANLNTPAQTIISGKREGIAAAVERFAAQGIGARAIPVGCAFHSPLVAKARERLAGALAQATFASPALTVYANATATPYPAAGEQAREVLAQHLVQPVYFRDEVLAMYEAGARIFVEVGPGSVLSGLVGMNLQDRPHLAINTDAPRGHGLTTFQHALGRLIAHGVSVRLDRLFAGRAAKRLKLAALVEETAPQPASPTRWLVNGGRARPSSAPAEQPYVAPLAAAPVHIPDSASAAAGLGYPAEPAGTGPMPAQISLPSSNGRHNEHNGHHNHNSHGITPPQAPTGGQPPGMPFGDEVEQVMVQFQQTMQQFLRTQSSVLQTYLLGAQPTGATLEPGLVQSPSHEALPVMASAPPVAVAPPSNGHEPHLPQAPQPQHAQSQLAQPQPAAGAEGEADVTAAASREVPSREVLTRQLLSLVAERTGYPPEMLKLDIDIEAKLGIDSIKRVEILGALQRTVIPPDRRLRPEAMEQLTAIKTLGGIIEWFEEALRAADAPQEAAPITPQDAEAAQPAPTAATPSSSRPVGVSRSVAVAVDAPPLHETTLRFAPDRVLLITDDEHGLAAALAGRLREQDIPVVRIGMAVGNGRGGGDVVRADLTDPAAVRQLVAGLRQSHGPIGGIVHLLPLRERSSLDTLDLNQWRQQLRLEVKSLFYLLQAAAPDLKRAPAIGGAWLVAATAFGPACGREADGPQIDSPGHAGPAGLIKSALFEWPGVQGKVVNLDLSLAIPELAAQLMAEMAAGDGLVEVSYVGNRRRQLRFAPAPLADTGSPEVELGPDAVVLVTGGARGITAEIALELAEKYRPTLVLAGSSPAPAEDEPGDLAGLTTPQQIRGAILEQMQRSGPPVLAQVEASFRQIQKEREARRNMEAMRRAGATVAYYQVDVRDEQAMRALVAEVYRRYGRLDGVIHGAGIIEDKLLEDKTPDSFDRVFDTKADSAFILSRVLRPESLKFLIFFTSAAGVFGNRGQGDYAATNEVVSKLSVYLNHRWPGRVAALSWGPWLKAGMVSDALEREFNARGIQTIPPSAGRAAFHAELRYGAKPESEVLLVAGAWDSPKPPRTADYTLVNGAANGSVNRPANGPANGPAPVLRNGGSHDGSPRLPVLPLLHLARPGASTGAYPTGYSIDLVRELDLAHDLFLADHRLDGKPVMPAAMVIELLAEIAQQAWPNKTLVSIDALRVLRGIILEEPTKTLQITGQARPDTATGNALVELEVHGAGHTGPPYYRATALLADHAPDGSTIPLPSLGALQPYPLSVAGAYEQWLFHGPRFQGISRIHGISAQGMAATCRLTAPAACLAGAPEGQWLIDPVMLDSGLQLIILWARHYHDLTPLPAGCKRYLRLGPPAGTEVTCYLQAQLAPDQHTVSGNLYFVDERRRLVGVLEQLECTGSKALNRLAGSHAR